jgi:hypothetical protein
MNMREGRASRRRYRHVYRPVLEEAVLALLFGARARIAEPRAPAPMRPAGRLPTSAEHEAWARRHSGFAAGG